MVSTEGPTFLFGDLGSGKSTLVGSYVISLADKANGVIPLLIPAKYFLGKLFDTIGNLAAQISEYVNGQIAPNTNLESKFDLISVLNNDFQVLIVIDGFDELDKRAAKELLQQAAG
ncbi:MAG: hypothetical protein FD167_4163, partial [bacterium]